jgi:hypothetical protein
MRLYHKGVKTGQRDLMARDKELRIEPDSGVRAPDPMQRGGKAASSIAGTLSRSNGHVSRRTVRVAEAMPAKARLRAMSLRMRRLPIDGVSLSRADK